MLPYNLNQVVRSPVVRKYDFLSTRFVFELNSRKQTNYSYFLLFDLKRKAPKYTSNCNTPLISNIYRHYHNPHNIRNSIKLIRNRPQFNAFNGSLFALNTLLYVKAGNSAGYASQCDINHKQEVYVRQGFDILINYTCFKLRILQTSPVN